MSERTSITQSDYELILAGITAVSKGRGREPALHVYLKDGATVRQNWLHNDPQKTLPTIEVHHREGGFKSYYKFV